MTDLLDMLSYIDSRRAYLVEQGYSQLQIAELTGMELHIRHELNKRSAAQAAYDEVLADDIPL